MVKLENVTITYQNRDVLNNVSIAIDTQKTTVLLGTSGSGKSTILKVLLGLIKLFKGKVVSHIESLSYDRVQELRQRIGYMNQGGGLFPHLTVLENMTLIPRYLGWSLHSLSQRIESLRELVQIDADLLSRYPQQVSGGQRQRAALMRALILDPPLMLLDEPFGALDPMTRYELQKDLKDIFTRLNKTVILVTHDLTEAEFFADKIYLLDQGEILQSGSFQDLRDRPEHDFVRKFFQAQHYLNEEIPS